MNAFPSIQEQILANPSVFSGAQLASVAFAQIPYIGTPLLVLGMISFSYSTILGWSYYGSRCITYLFGKRAIKPYQVIYLVVAILGAIGVGDIVWTISDIGNALMAIPNIIMVLLLSGMIAKETKYYIYDDNLDEVDETPNPTVALKVSFPIEMSLYIEVSFCISSGSLIKSLCIRAYFQYQSMSRDKACLFVARRNPKEALL